MDKIKEVQDLEFRNGFFLGVKETCARLFRMDIEEDAVELMYEETLKGIEAQMEEQSNES